MSILVVWLVLIFLVMLYILPSFIAAHRQHPQLGPIAVINILFGWTLIGWGIALAWACSNIQRPISLPPPLPYEQRGEAR